jgi:glycosyltransferase involved in cell wall biosynthesis
MLSVVIPAHNEEDCLGACLCSILAQDAAFPVQVVVCINGATDRTALVAIAHADAFRKRGMTLTIVITATAGKPHALNLAEAFCTYASRVYLDADTTISPGVLSGLAAVLARSEPAYATASMKARAGSDLFSRAYVKVWTRLPAISDCAHGIGLYAVNASGRRRWRTFPTIHSDDKFVRLLFSAAERHKLPGQTYTFPIAGGLTELVSLRTRWCRGNLELRAAHPEIRDDLQLRLRSYIAFLRGVPSMPVASVVCLFVFAIAVLRAVSTQRLSQYPDRSLTS